MSDAQDLVVAVRDYLVAQFDGKVDQLNDTYKDADSPVDTVRLRHLGSIFTAERKRSTIQKYPAVYILSNDSRNLNYKSGSDDWSHTIEIGLLEQHQDPDRLDDMIKRYMEDVVWTLLKAGHFADGIGGYHLVVSPDAATADTMINWGPTIPTSGTMTQDAKLTLRMEG